MTRAITGAVSREGSFSTPSSPTKLSVAASSKVVGGEAYLKKGLIFPCPQSGYARIRERLNRFLSSRVKVDELKEKGIIADAVFGGHLSGQVFFFFFFFKMVNLTLVTGRVRGSGVSGIGCGTGCAVGCDQEHCKSGTTLGRAGHLSRVGQLGAHPAACGQMQQQPRHIVSGWRQRCALCHRPA
jgi:hypothetical protein